MTFHFFVFDIFNSQEPNDNGLQSWIMQGWKIDDIFIRSKRKTVRNSIRYLGDRYTNNLPCLISWRNYVDHLILLYSYLESEFNISSLSMHNCTQEYMQVEAIQIIPRHQNSLHNIERQQWITLTNVSPLNEFVFVTAS